MRAIVQDRYGSPDVLTPAVIEATRARRARRAASGPRGRPRPRHLAPDDRPALPDARHRVRLPAAEEPGPRPRRRGHRRGRRAGRDPVCRGRRGVRRARGSYAEYAAANEDKLARKPANISLEQAAVVPVSGLIAQRGLVDVGRLEAGQRVLITGASGGVGSYAVQLARPSAQRSPP